MFRKIISLFTLAALLANTVGLTGCTSTVKVPADEVNLDPPKKTIRIKLKTGGYVLWNANGASYVPRAKLFDGMTDEGERQHTRLDSVDSVYFVMGENTTEQVLDAESFHRDCISKRRDSIRGEIKRLVCVGDTVEFRNNSARIDTTAHAVVGVTKDGETVTVPLDQIQRLEIRRGAPGKTFLLVLGVGTLAFVVAVGIALSTTDWGLGSGGGGTW